MNEGLFLTIFIILIVISEAIAQNYIKKGSINGDLKYLFVSIFFYGWICYMLYKLYGRNNMGSTFAIWSITSSITIYLLGFLMYDEFLTLNDIIGFLLCAIGLYLIFIADHKKSDLMSMSILKKNTL
jgi:multidrug transporter EmrE-like cation transporter